MSEGEGGELAAGQPQESVAAADAATVAQPPAVKPTSEELDRCARTVYFARVPPCVPLDEIREVFGSCGPIVEVNLFRPWATAKTSKGCGLVEFATVEAAQKAISGFNGCLYWQDAYSPMLVEQMALDKCRKHKAVVAAAGSGPSSSSTGSGPSSALPNKPGSAASSTCSSVGQWSNTTSTTINCASTVSGASAGTQHSSSSKAGSGRSSHLGGHLRAPAPLSYVHQSAPCAFTTVPGGPVSPTSMTTSCNTTSCNTLRRWPVNSPAPPPVDTYGQQQQHRMLHLMQQQLQMQQQQQLDGGGNMFLVQRPMVSGPEMRHMLSPSGRQFTSGAMLVGQGVFDVVELQKANSGVTQRVSPATRLASDDLLAKYKAQLVQHQQQELQQQQQELHQQQLLQQQQHQQQLLVAHAQRQALQQQAELQTQAELLQLAQLQQQQQFVSGSSFVDAAAAGASGRVSGAHLMSGQSITTAPWDDEDANPLLSGNWDASVPVHVPGFPSGQRSICVDGPLSLSDVAAYTNMEATSLLGSELAGLTLGGQVKKPPLAPLQPTPTPPLHSSDSGGFQMLQGPPHGGMGRATPIGGIAGSPDVDMYSASCGVAAEQQVPFKGPSSSLLWQGPQQQQQQQALPAPPPPPPPPPPPRQQQQQQQLRQRQQQQQAAAAAAAAVAAQCVEPNNTRPRRGSWLRGMASWIRGNTDQQRQPPPQQQQQQQQPQELVQSASIGTPQRNFLLSGMDLDLPKYAHVSAECFASSAGPICSSSAGGGSQHAALLLEQHSAPSNVVGSSQLLPALPEARVMSLQLPKVGQGPVHSNNRTMRVSLTPNETASMAQQVEPLMRAFGISVRMEWGNASPELILEGEQAAVAHAMQYVMVLQQQGQE